MSVEVAEIEHSRRGPSGADIWLNCQGEPFLVAKLVKELGPSILEAGPAADEGTAAHWLLSTCLQTGDMPWEHAGEAIKIESSGRSFIVDDEMIEGVQLALDTVARKMEQYADKHPLLFVEQRVASPEHPEAFGTSDIFIIIPGERIIIIDFKYGRIIVEPDAPQLRLYGQYAFETFRVLDGKQAFPDPYTVCELYIVQPRSAGHPKGPVRHHVTNQEELARFFYGEALPALKAGPDSVLTMGSWCEYCPAAKLGRCPALQRGVTEMDVVRDPLTMSDELLGETRKKLAIAVAYKKLIDRECFARAKNGHKIPGTKLVQMKGDRIWKPDSEKTLVAVYGNDAYTDPKLKSPPQIEALKKGELQLVDPATGEVTSTLKGANKIVAFLAMKPETGVTLADEDDPRDEVKSQMDAFDKATGVTDEGANEL